MSSEFDVARARLETWATGHTPHGRDIAALLTELDRRVGSESQIRQDIAKRIEAKMKRGQNLMHKDTPEVNVRIKWFAKGMATAVRIVKGDL